MNRGTTRRRSSSSEDGERDRPRQRQRLLHPSSASLPGPLPIPPATHPSSPALSATPSSAPLSLSESGTTLHPMANMGHPVLSTNGHGSNGSTAEAGPSSNGFRAPTRYTGSDSRVELVQPSGSLMYEDDRDWTEDHMGDTTPVDHEMPGTEDSARKTGTTGKRMPVDREEVVRLILQGLRDIGYHQSADVLEAESGFQLSIPSAVDFQNAILGGRWSEALHLLPELGIDIPASSTPSAPPPTDDPPASSSNSMMSMKTASSSLQDSPAQQVKFSIAQQKYLEYLELGLQKKALNTLRQELAPVIRDSDTLHNLSGYMMCLDKDDLYERAAWDGAAGTSRRKLLEHLQSFISPQLMVPQRRLATLLEQARHYQASHCAYHQDSEIPSLYVDHECSFGQFPSITTHVLADHTDEVWRIEWSPDGTMLASAGKDKQVVIWLLESMPKSEGGSSWSVRPLHHLKDHRDPVDVMAWSPDGQTLVTGADKGLYLWNTKTGTQKMFGTGASPHADQISAIQWKPDGSEFLVASMDCKLIFYSPTGMVSRQWNFKHLQINDFIITPDATRLVAVTTSLKRVPIEDKLTVSMSTRPATSSRYTGVGVIGDAPVDFDISAMEHTLMVIRLADKEITDWSANLQRDVTGIKLSWDGKRILINCNPDEIQMWTLDPLKPMRNFKGHMQNLFLIRSGFGAPKDRFVLSGSEDNHVYVWRANNPHPVQVLAGHDNTVNCVAWNPIAGRKIFASCSDDATVRIWQPPEPMPEDPQVSTNGSAIRAENGVKVEDGDVGMTGDAEGLLL